MEILIEDGGENLIDQYIRPQSDPNEKVGEEGKGEGGELEKEREGDLNVNEEKKKKMTVEFIESYVIQQDLLPPALLLPKTPNEREKKYFIESPAVHEPPSDVRELTIKNLDTG